MIVYNAGTRFFDMKSDATTHRVAQGLPVSALHKVTINTRQELAAFLDGLCNLPGGPENSPVEATAKAEFPKWLPLFLQAKLDINNRPDDVPLFWPSPRA